MDQIYQLQQQIQRLRQEINNISQMTSQLQQFEQNNAAQLQQLRQHEVNASQQLQRIQQVCNQVNNDLNIVSGAAQQITQGMAQGGAQFGTGYAGGFGQQAGGFGQQSGNFGQQAGGFGQQAGTYGTQLNPGQTGISGTTQQYQPNYTSAAPWQQQRLGTGFGTGAYQSGLGGFAQTYATPGIASTGYASPNQFGGNQSFAQNQLISQQAQQAMANRMNQSFSNQGSQFGTSTYNPVF